MRRITVICLETDRIGSNLTAKVRCYYVDAPLGKSLFSYLDELGIYASHTHIFDGWPEKIIGPMGGIGGLVGLAPAETTNLALRSQAV